MVYDDKFFTPDIVKIVELMKCSKANRFCKNPIGYIDEMHPSDHRYGENYQKNHNQPSKIDRTQFRKDKRGYWETEWDK